MKTLYAITFCLQLVGVLHAQKLKSDEEQLAAVLSNFELVSINSTSFLEEIDEGVYTGQIVIRNKARRFTVKQNVFLIENIQNSLNSVLTTDEKSNIEVYAGYLNEQPDNFVRISIYSNTVEGLFMLDDTAYFLRSKQNILGSSRSDSYDHIIFSNRDILTNPNIGDCGWVEEARIIQNHMTQISSGQMLIGSTNCDILEIATEADFEYYQQNGSSVSSTNSAIISALNQVEGVYTSTFGIKFTITHQSVWSSTSDPYSAVALGGVGTGVLTELSNYWIANRSNVKRDAVYFFSGKTGHTIRGSAASGTIGRLCEVSDGTYAFTATNVANINIVNTTAHEIGHLFNASHVGSSNCFTSLMCTIGSAVDTRPLLFASSSTSQMNSWISSNSSCLSEMSSITITGTDPVCTTKTFQVSGLPSGSTVTSWSSNTSNLSVSGGSGYSVTATRNNNYDGFATITAFGTIGGTGGCTYTVSKEVYVGKPGAPVNQKLNGGTYYPGIPVCPGSHYVTVSPASGPTPTSYTWTVPSGVSSYANGALLNFTFPSSLSSVSLTVKANNACGSSSNTSFYITKKTFGCSFFSLVLYPNPSGDNLNIEAFIETEDNEIIPAEDVVPDNIMVFDMIGNQLLKITPDSYKSTISLAGLDPGEYVVHIVQGKDIVKKHIVKQ